MGVDQLCLYTSFTYMGTNHVVSGPNLCDFLLFRSKHKPNKMLDNWHIHKNILCGCLGMQQIQFECNFILVLKSGATFFIGQPTIKSLGTSSKK